jgi:hypothetical protein
MKIKNLLRQGIIALSLFFYVSLKAQVPVANFSVTPNPACTNTNNAVQIIDLSTNSPTAWSYTVAIFGPGPGGTAVYNTQNPTVSFNFPGTYTITLVSTNAAGSSATHSQTLTVLRSPNANINPANVNSCIGATPVTINVNAVGPGAASDTFSWSTGATSNSITVSPNVTTTYSCIVTATNGCTSILTSQFNIGQPTITVNSFPTSLCPGNNATITAGVSGPGPRSYTWSTGASTNSLVTSTAAVYTVIATNGLGCTATQTYNLGSSTTLSLTATANASNICSGNTVFLQASGASSYTWSNGANTANTTANPAVTTTFNVFGSYATCVGLATVVVTVSQIPTITVVSSTNSICSGSTVFLNASGASTYTWNPGQVVGSGISVTPSVNTTYTVRGQNPGCPTRASTVTIAVLQSPNLSVSSSASVVCAGEQVALAAAGAISYSWSNGGISAVIIVSPSVTTTYSVTGVSLNNCSRSVSFIQNIDNCTSIAEISADKFIIYPNPNNGIFRIESAAASQISIINQTGQTIRQLSLAKANDFTITVSDLSEGIYFVVGQNDRGIFRQKVVISK